MAFQSGTFSSFTDLHGTIKGFAIANGWTNPGGLDVLTKSGQYVRLVLNTTGTDYILIQGGTGETGGVLDTTNGQNVRMSENQDPIGQMPFPGDYYLFAHAAPDCIFCVIKYNSIYHQHLAWGDITKYGTWNGGAWTSSTANATSRVFGTVIDAAAIDVSNNWCSGCFLFTENSAGNGSGAGATMLCDIDGNEWLRTLWYNNGTTYGPPDAGFSGSQQATNFCRKLDPTHEQPVLAPCTILMNRPSAKTSIIGDIPHVRYLRVDNYNPADIITVGSDKWMVFPHRHKTGTRNSGGNGWAIAYDGP